ncbi:MAG TPA: HD domain-containing protein [Candidatus Limnocylindria bacterium]|jgi:poly(A) polymerase/tRNA nucleotidyltransferase (CCA-adding enzyme)
MTSAPLALAVPKDVERVVDTLIANGFEAFVVGGCVRDAIRGVDPQDWDVATSAKPDEIQSLFERSLYTNRFGTVVVSSGGHEVEVTTYRVEADYADHRRPDEVAFTESLHEDLARRDFTMNAMAWRPAPGGGELVDPFGGRIDLEAKVVRAVGVPADRFAEDALRMLRAVRFATVLRMTIETGTADAILAHAQLTTALSGERIQQELNKILLADRPSTGIRLLSDLGVLAVLCPELEICKSIPQDKAVAQDVFEHSLITVDATPPHLVLRLAGLFHDVGKPETMADGHFHQHEFVGEAIARRVLRRWKYPKDTVSAVAHLIRHHMFWYQSDWTGSAVRRFIRKVGLEVIPDLFALRRADNIGSGVRAPRLYALEDLWTRVQEEIDRSTAFSPHDLVVDGTDVMRELGIGPGREVGRVIAALFERVLDDPDLNARERLIALIREVGATAG